MHLHFPRSAEPGTAGSVGHSRHLFAQQKYNRRLFYYQEQLWVENVKIGMGARGSYCFHSRFLPHLNLFLNQGSRDLPKVLLKFKVKPPVSTF